MTNKRKQCAIVTGMFIRVAAISTIVSAVVLFLVLAYTSPATAGPLGLLLLFVSAYVLFVGCISAVIYGVRRLIVFTFQNTPRAVPLKPMAFRRAYHYAVPLAAAPVMLIGLQSVSPIGLKEFILVAIFEVIACIYVSKRIR